MYQSCDGQGVPHLSPKVDWVSENLSENFLRTILKLKK